MRMGVRRIFDWRGQPSARSKATDSKRQNPYRPWLLDILSNTVSKLSVSTYYLHYYWQSNTTEAAYTATTFSILQHLLYTQLAAECQKYYNRQEYIKLARCCGAKLQLTFRIFIVKVP